MCDPKRASEALQARAIPPSTLSPLTRQSSIMGPADDVKN